MAVPASDLGDQADGYVGTGAVACVITGVFIAALAWPLGRVLGDHEHVQTLAAVALLATPIYILGGFWNSP